MDPFLGLDRLERHTGHRRALRLGMTATKDSDKAMLDGKWSKG